MVKRIICIAVALMMAGVISGCKPAEKPAEKPAAEGKHEVHWGYQGEGAPANWGKLKPEFALCGTGMSQSPIDFSKGYKTKLDAI